MSQALTRVPTSVHAHETKSHPPQKPTPVCNSRIDPSNPVAFRHSGWQFRRRVIFAALQSLGLPAARLKRWLNCGANAWLLRSRSEPDRYKLVSDRCRDRFCVPCARERARVVSLNLLGHIQKRQVRFITLTLKASRMGLGSCIDRLYESFARLRRSKLWSDTQVGGVTILEVTWSRKSEAWHPHLHILTEGKYINQAALSHRWLRITADSYIVDVRAIKDPAVAARYVAKYASKGITADALGEPGRLKEAILALSGRRLLSTYGTWRGLNLSHVEPSDDWEYLGLFSAWLQRARSGDPAAVRLLNHLYTRSNPSCRETRTTALGP